MSELQEWMELDDTTQGDLGFRSMGSRLGDVYWQVSWLAGERNCNQHFNYNNMERHLAFAKETSILRNRVLLHSDPKAYNQEFGDLVNRGGLRDKSLDVLKQQVRTIKK